MTPIEELNTILTLLRKYNLPISPILEYAINEKKEELGLDTNSNQLAISVDESPYVKKKQSIQEDIDTIVLTRELIEAARTPNGGFTKYQLAAIGIEWPPPVDWIEQMIGVTISSLQYREFCRIQYVSKKSSKKDCKKRGTRS